MDPRFEQFKENLLRENEEKYGKEIREKYGDEAVDASNEKLRRMNEQSLKKAEKLGIIIMEKLKEGFAVNDVEGPLGKEIYELHKEWIMCYWSEYSVQSHRGLADMYVADPRFKAYYDGEQEGLAEFLRTIIHYHAVSE